ncbi:MAG: nucleotide sugar dehydrogenase [Bacteroidales bacterium]
MFKEFSGNETICVIGLGYVGLPIALEFAKKQPVIGFDIKPERIELLKKHIDPSKELKPEDFKESNITFTCEIEDIRPATIFIVAVPTPIDSHKLPDLQPLLKASITVGKVLKRGDYVIYESTVYPGCTEEDCIPVLEEVSGLYYKDDFKVGYSPERINPGDKNHTLTKITKVVSGCDEIAQKFITKLYSSIITAGVHCTSSIKVAEAAKIIENTQRDVNIALMNELSMIFHQLNINTYEVLEAAGTKWNFLKFMPGLVGGHCIGVDPYYLTHKAAELGIHAHMITSGRAINDGMPAYIANQTIKKMVSLNKAIKGAKVLIMGITFKENVSDIRNSKVAELYYEFKAFGTDIDVIDPYADAKEVMHEYNIVLSGTIRNDYDVIVLAVSHDKYLEYTEDYFKSIGNDPILIIDIKGVLRNKIKRLDYMSL